MAQAIAEVLLKCRFWMPASVESVMSVVFHCVPDGLSYFLKHLCNPNEIKVLGEKWPESALAAEIRGAITVAMETTDITDTTDLTTASHI
jgi:hypothetical protein